MFWTVEKDREITSLREAGHSLRKIAELASDKFERRITHNSVKARLERLSGRRHDDSGYSRPDYSEQVETARRLRAEGLSWNSIARQLGGSKETLRCRCDPEYREYINRENRRRKAAIKAGEYKPKSVRLVAESYQQRNPLYDPKRDGVREPETLTAFLLGDPWPGRAELMRKVG